MDINRNRPLPNHDPNQDRRGCKPITDISRESGRVEKRSSPIIQQDFNKNAQSQQVWQAPDGHQPLTNQDEQGKITNAENSDNVIGETDT